MPFFKKKDKKAGGIVDQPADVSFDAAFDADEPMLIDMDSDNLLDLLESGGEKQRFSFLRGFFRLNRIPTKVYVIIMLLLLALTIAGGLFLFTRVSGWANSKEDNRTAGRIYINNSAQNPNSANFIYNDMKLYAGGGEVTGVDEEGNDIIAGGEYVNLKKMSLDNSASVFYFYEDFDFSKYDISLTDLNDNYLCLDLSYMRDGSLQFPANTVRFAPLPLGARGFFLNIKNLETKEVISNEFYFTDMHAITPSLNFLARQSINRPNGENIGGVYGMFFSSTASTVYFGLNDSENTYPVRFINNADGYGSSVTITDRGRNLYELRPEPLIFDTAKEDLILGRIDFEPLSTLTGTAKISFNNLFVELPFRKTVDATQIFGSSDEKDQYSFITDNYEIVFERVLSKDDTFIFVYHGRDLNAERDPNNKYAGRAEVVLDCDLVITLSDGTRVTLEPTIVRSKDIGANLVYDYSGSEHYSLIKSHRYGSFELVSKSALVSLGNIEIPLDLQTATTRQPDIVENLVEYYEKQYGDKEMYTIQVLAYEWLGNETFAIVQEFWLDPDTDYYKITTREVKGYIEDYSVILEVDKVLSQTTGLKGNWGAEED